MMNLKEIKKDLLIGIKECADRGLYHSAKWLAELNYSIKDTKINFTPEAQTESDELEDYQLAKLYFDLKEYDRCAFFLKECKTKKPRFLYFYAQYLSIEKKKLDSITDTTCPSDPKSNQPLMDLHLLMAKEYVEKTFDGYTLYIYGLVLKKLDLIAAAIEVFIEAVTAAPLLWSAWLELSILIPNRNKLCSLLLKDHWIRKFFMGHAYLEQLNNDEALQICLDLQANGFEKSFYLLAQTAIVYHNRRNLEMAIDGFKALLKEDPFRLDNMDIYSNLLYVQEMKCELADLAHKAVTIDKYRVETCCIIGNYYSLRSDHPKAVIYFQRALKLNPYYLSAWTLMGHEYMEMKNTNAAIQSYRQAIEINKRDYRAWYGLGQTYEILKMPAYSLYYYKQSQQLRPSDSRMMIALGETYERLEKNEHAIQCYYKACHIGDIEGTALTKLAKLYDKLGLYENAANAYTEFCMREEADSISSVYEEQSDYYNALQYLANYHLRRSNLGEAYNYAYKCLDNIGTKESARALLKTIAAKRGEQGDKPDLSNIFGNSNVHIDDSCNLTNTELVDMDESGTVDMDESESDSFHSML